MEYPGNQNMAEIVLCQNSTCVVVTNKKWGPPGLKPGRAGGQRRLRYSIDLASFMQETCNTGPSDGYEREKNRIKWPVGYEQKLKEKNVCVS